MQIGITVSSLAMQVTRNARRALASIPMRARRAEDTQTMEGIIIRKAIESDYDAIIRLSKISLVGKDYKTDYLAGVYFVLYFASSG